MISKVGYGLMVFGFNSSDCDEAFFSSIIIGYNVFNCAVFNFLIFVFFYFSSFVLLFICLFFIYFRVAGLCLARLDVMEITLWWNIFVTTMIAVHHAWLKITIWYLVHKFYIFFTFTYFGFSYYSLIHISRTAIMLAKPVATCIYPVFKNNRRRKNAIKIRFIKLYNYRIKKPLQIFYYFY